MKKNKLESHNIPYRKPLAIACYKAPNGNLQTRNLYNETEIKRLIEGDIREVGFLPCVLIYRDTMRVDYLF